METSLHDSSAAPASQATLRPGSQPEWVLDTNVVLDWLVFADAGVARLARALDGGRVRIATRADCRRELCHVLVRAQLPIDVDAAEGLIARYDAAAIVIDTEPTVEGAARTLPRCRDASDQKFLELARDSGARWLVTKDRALLHLARRVAAAGFAIVTPKEAESLVEPEAEPLG